MPRPPTGFSAHTPHGGGTGWAKKSGPPLSLELSGESWVSECNPLGGRASLRLTPRVQVGERPQATWSSLFRSVARSEVGRGA